jgi:hypothetical protein
LPSLSFSIPAIPIAHRDAPADHFIAPVEPLNFPVLNSSCAQGYPFVFDEQLEFAHKEMIAEMRATVNKMRRAVSDADVHMHHVDSDEGHDSAESEGSEGSEGF